MSMPTPVITHPIRRGPGAALPAIWDGSAKMPLPIIDPTTIAVRAARPRPRFTPGGRAGSGLVSTVSNIVVSQLGMAQGGFRLASPDGRTAALRAEEALVLDHEP